MINLGKAPQKRGFTILELLTVLVIIGILVTMLVPVFANLVDKADRGTCSGNLRSLYVAASAYIQDQGHWPQISTKNLQGTSYALDWYQAFERYGIAPKSWVCPTVQRKLKNPDLSKNASPRVDYFATPFSDEPRAAYKYDTQPWFAERGDVHGDGNLLIFPDGRVRSLAEVIQQR